MPAGSDSRRTNGAALNRAQQLGNRQPKDASCAGGADEFARMWCQPADSVLGESTVAARRDLVGLEAPFLAGSDHRVLAQAEQPRRRSGADQPGDAAHGGNGCSGHGVDVLDTEAAVPARRGFSGRQRAAYHGTKNSRLADAQTTGHFPRTDQTLQDVCRTNASVSRVDRPPQPDPWYSESEVVDI